MNISISNNDRAQKLYSKLLESADIDASRYSLVVVQHILPNSVPLFKALRARFHINAIIPKPKSINPAALEQLEGSDPPFRVLHCSRQQLQDPEYININIVDHLDGRMLLLLDIGGYFASSVDLLAGILGDRFAGIVEDTENGHQKYDETAA